MGAKKSDVLIWGPFPIPHPPGESQQGEFRGAKAPGTVLAMGIGGSKLYIKWMQKYGKSHNITNMTNHLWVHW